MGVVQLFSVCQTPSSRHWSRCFVEWLISDFKDAFWLIPVRASERKHFVGRLFNKYLVYLRTAPGTSGAPISWAAVAGLVARLTQNFFTVRKGCRRKQEKVRLCVYVDDPLCSIRGAVKARARSAGSILVDLPVLGFPQALSKASTWAVVEWICCVLSMDGGKIQVKIPEEKIAELVRLTEQFLENLELRSYMGRAMNVASFIFVWRPFLSEVWAALAAAPSTGAPSNCVRIQQIRHGFAASQAALKERWSETSRWWRTFVSVRKS